MRPILGRLAGLALMAAASGASARDLAHPAGDSIALPTGSHAHASVRRGLKATLYHAGPRLAERDSLGCRTSPMRTVAIDPAVVAPRSIVFIKETAGLVLADGSVHDGY